MPARDIDRDFGPSLRSLRVDKGLSQEELAAAANGEGAALTQATIGKIERGERRVTVGEASALAHALDLPLTYLTVGKTFVDSEILRRRLRQLRNELTDALAAFESGQSLAAMEADSIEGEPDELLRDAVLESVEDVIKSYKRDQLTENEASERRKELAFEDEGGVRSAASLPEGLFADRDSKFGHTVTQAVIPRAASVIFPSRHEDADG